MGSEQGKIVRGKRLFRLWICLILQILFVVCVPVVYAAELSAGEERVFDYAGLFSDEEKQMLEDKARELREEMQAELIVLTVEESGGRQAQEVADGFYFLNGFDKSFHENGLVMLIDMDNMELYLGTYGDIVRVLTDWRLDQILDLLYEQAAEGRYAEAALAGLAESGRYFQKGIVSGQYNYDVETGKISIYHTIRWYEAFVAVVFSGFVAGLVCWNVRRHYQMGAGSETDSLKAYQKNCQFQFHKHTDQLIDTIVHHTVIVRHNSGGRSGGASSSRRSSTHSYRGHTAGGRGRKF